MGSSVGFDFWLPGGSLGGFCWLGPGFVAGLVGEGRPYVLVKDLDARPAPGRLDVRAEGLWAAFNDEAGDGSHWSWGLEAFGVAFDDPEDAVRSEWGDRVALGFDLEWEAPDRVHGEILVGPAERLPFTGFGREKAGISAFSRPNGLAAPVRVEGGRVLRQWLTADGWVRAWDESAGGTA